MHNLYGIVSAADGSLVQVMLSEISGVWKVITVKRRELDCFTDNLLLLNKKMILGIESRWVHKQVPDFLSLKTADESSGEFHACAQSTNYSLYTEAIASNLYGAYPDDAYLCTIPVHFADTLSHSFVTISKENDFYKVGIIIQMKLVVVFSVPASDNFQLKGVLSRIKRYWNGLDTDKIFPGTVVLLNVPELSIDDVVSVKKISFHPDDLYVAKAAGVALCGIEDGVPAYCRETDACKFRVVRSAAMLASVSLFLLSIILVIVLSLTNVYVNHKVSISKKEYNAIIDQNKEIRELFRNGSQLAEQLARLDSVGTRRSSWAKLLYNIGSQKPAGLYIEKIGSDKINKSNDFKIALAGWSANETAVTEMLKRMNKSQVVANATLQTLQQDTKKNNLYTFKILCQLKSEK